MSNFHAASHKIQSHAPSRDPIDPIDGSQAALSLLTLTNFLVQDAASSPSPPSEKIIILITDHLYQPEDLYFAIQTASDKGVSLKIIHLCAAGTGADLATTATDWNERENSLPPGRLSVSIVEIAGKLAVQSLARTLISSCKESLPPLQFFLEFNVPLIGDVRYLQLEASSETQPLDLSISHCSVCACHSAPLALTPAGSRGERSSSTTATTTRTAFPFPLHQQHNTTTTNNNSNNAMRCPVTGTTVDGPRCIIHDGRTVCIGNSPACVLHFSAPLTIAAATTGGLPVVRVLKRVPINKMNAALLYGPPIILKMPSSSSSSSLAAVNKVVLDGQMVDVHMHQILSLVSQSLRSKNEALVTYSTCDLRTGRSSLFRQYYLIVPSQCKAGDETTLCALRMASIEELAPQSPTTTTTTPTTEARLTEAGPAVAAAVLAQLQKVPVDTEMSSTSTLYSSKVHETLEMLIRESKVLKPHPPGAGAAVAVQEAPVAAPAVVQERPVSVATGKSKRANGNGERDQAARGRGGGRGGGGGGRRR